MDNKMINQLVEDINMLKIKNENLENQLFSERKQRLEMSVIMVEILETLKKNNIEINMNKVDKKVKEENIKNEKEQIVSNIVEDYDTLSDDDITEELNNNLPETLIDDISEDIEDNIVKPPSPRRKKLNNTQQKLETNELVIVENYDEPPLPPNLDTSPMTPENEIEDENVETVETYNYKKMKVGELKKLCKKRGFKGFSKLKKDQLIELLS